MDETPGDGPGTVTQLLARSRAGDDLARDQLFRHVEGDLRRVAGAMIRRGGWGPSAVQGTELVNMACARLLGRGDIAAEDRRHFFRLFGRAMHDVLVEEARRSSAARRGGDRRRVHLIDFVVEGETFQMDILDLRDALKELHARDPEGALVIKGRFFAGQSLAEMAEVMGSTIPKVRGNWEYARAWLLERLGGSTEQ